MTELEAEVVEVKVVSVAEVKLKGQGDISGWITPCQR